MHAAAAAIRESIENICTNPQVDPRTMVGILTFDSQVRMCVYNVCVCVCILLVCVCMACVCICFLYVGHIYIYIYIASGSVGILSFDSQVRMCV